MADAVVRQVKIMISSTRADLLQYREEAVRIIGDIGAENERKLQLVVVAMEKETQSGDRELPIEVSKRWVQSADWVVVIVGWHYGTIPDEPDAEGLSVTEWEFREAEKEKKKLFVFVTGEPNTANQYRWSTEERDDLKDWRRGDDERIRGFRDRLCARHVEMFSNLRSFRERLQRTLREAIADRPPEIDPGTPAAAIIVAAIPEISGCLRMVAKIANWKKIHDHLHDLRHLVIRPLREEVLSLWKQEGKLSQSRESTIWAFQNVATAQLTSIKEVSGSIGPEHQGLRNSVDDLLRYKKLWHEEASRSRRGWAELCEGLETFAYKVQIAFSEADKCMATDEDRLREHYSALLAKLKNARERLPDPDRQRLVEELENIDANRSRLRGSLSTHHEWQLVHNDLHELDSYRESEIFTRNLNLYRGGTKLSTLLDLVQKERALVEAAGGPASGAGPTSESAAAGQALAILPPACKALPDELHQLDSWLRAVREGDGVAAFDKMRGLFDNVFYCVDKRTLYEVSRAHDRAVAMQDWLNELVADALKAA